MQRLYEDSGDARLRLVYGQDEIADATERVAHEINRDFSGEELLLVIVLKGAFIFAADLARRLALPVRIDFVKLASYNGMETTGGVEITKDIEVDIAGRNVLVVEDIIDTGITLDYLLKHLAARKPKSLKVCALIQKEERRRLPVKVDYAGIVCEKGFLVGYGLDFNENYRELEAIYELVDLPSSGGLNDNPM